MAWVKTDAGRREMQTRSLVNARPQRNLLLLIDGKRTEEELLASVVGTQAADFLALRDLGLIASPEHPAPAAASIAPAPLPMEARAPERIDAAHPLSAPHASPPANDAQDVAVELPKFAPTAPSFDHLSKTLTALIASELGLRGFALTLALERASGIEALLEVADRVVTQIGHRKGEVAADKARRALFGR